MLRMKKDRGSDCGQAPIDLADLAWAFRHGNVEATQRAMAETRSYGKKKEEWERKIMLQEGADRLPPPRPIVPRVSHWGSPVGTPTSVSPDGNVEGEEVSISGTETAERYGPFVYMQQAAWAVADEGGSSSGAPAAGGSRGHNLSGAR